MIRREHRRLRRSLHLAATYALILTAACASSESPRADHQAAAERPDSIALAPVFTIGDVDGPPEYAFGRLSTVLPAPHGGFYTCDQQDMRVRYYDEGGVFVREVGRRGSGPAEYRDCVDLALGRDSALIVSDPANGRFVFFSAAGEFTHVVNAVIGGGLGGENTFLVDTAGRLWKKGWLLDDAVEERNLPTQYVILTTDGQRLDSVRVPAPGQSEGLGFMLCTNDGCYRSAPVDSLSAVGKTGLVAVATPRRYSVELRHADGRVLTLERPDAAVRYGAGEAAEWNAWLEFFDRQSGTPVHTPLRADKPLIRALRIDDVGRIWVHVHATAEKRDVPPRKPGDTRPLLTWRERNHFDLFNGESAEYLGRVVLPPATELMASRGDRVWLREEGAAGEQRLGVYDLVRTPRP